MGSIIFTMKYVRLLYRTNFVLLWIYVIYNIFQQVPSTDKRTVYNNRNFRNIHFFNRKHKLSCEKIFHDNFEEISGEYIGRPLRNDHESFKLFRNCTKLFETHFYPYQPLSEEERRFPLAYVLLVNEHLEQFELFLNSIYSPQNVYCIHVDMKSPWFFHNALENLASCFSNVFLTTERIPVSRTSINMLMAQRICLKELYEGKRVNVHWKYVITLQGHDFPLKTNNEIVKVLQLHKGGNDIELASANVE